MLAGNANAIADGDELPTPTQPVGLDTFTQPMQLARIHQYLSMATPPLWSRQPDTVGVLGLAIAACSERNGHIALVDRIRELLEAAQSLWLTVPELTDETDRLDATRLTFRLIHLADIEAVTAAA